MPVRRKIGLVMMLAGSLITAVLSIEKTIVLAIGPRLDPDAQYNSSLRVLWNFLEADFVIIMGCVPTLHDMAKLDFSCLNHLSSAISRFAKGGWGRTSPRSHGDSQPGTYGYLEMDNYERGMAGVNPTLVASDPDTAHGSAETVQRLVPEAAPSQVLRTDEFTVSYAGR